MSVWKLLEESKKIRDAATEAGKWVETSCDSIDLTIGKGTEVIVSTGLSVRPTEEKDANKKFIVHACNLSKTKDEIIEELLDAANTARGLLEEDYFENWEDAIFILSDATRSANAMAERFQNQGK